MFRFSETENDGSSMTLNSPPFSLRPYNFAASPLFSSQMNIAGGSNIQINGDAEQDDQSINPQTRRFPLVFSINSPENNQNESNDDRRDDEQIDGFGSSQQQMRPINSKKFKLSQNSFELENREAPKIFLSSIKNEKVSDLEKQTESEQEKENKLQQPSDEQKTNADRPNENEINQENSKSFAENLNIPTQDAGEEESMEAENSNNIAYSYSSYVPSYQIAPNRYHHPQQLSYLGKFNFKLNFDDKHFLSQLTSMEIISCLR